MNLIKATRRAAKSNAIGVNPDVRYKVEQVNATDYQVVQTYKGNTVAVVAS